MRRWLALGLFALAGAVEAQPLTGGLLGRGASYGSFVPPASAATGCVGIFLGSPLALGCTDVVYTVATKSLDVTDGRVQAANLKAIPLPASGSVTVTPVLSQIGAITVVAGSALADGDALSVGDGTGVVPIEFDASPGDGTSGGAVPIIFDGTETATQIRDAVRAILDAAGRDWTTSAQGADGIGLVRATPGATGGAITESVADAGFTVTDWTNPTAATGYTYSLQACLADGTCNAAGPASTTAAGVATLSAAQLNRLSWSAVPGSALYKIRRDVGGASQGVIWSGTALTVDDTGLAGDGTGKPADDATGTVTAGRVTVAAHDGTAGELSLLNLGDAAGIGGDRGNISTGVTRLSGTASLMRNTYWDEATAKVLMQYPAHPAAYVEVGEEGVTLHSVPAGATPVNDNFHENLQVRHTGVDALYAGLPASGKFVQFKTPMFASFSSAAYTGADTHQWGGGSQPFLYLQSNEDRSDTSPAGEWIRLEQESASATGPSIDFLKARGTAASKSAGLASDVAGCVAWGAWDSAAWQQNARVCGGLRANAATGVAPGFLDLQTSATNSAGLATRVRLSDIAADGTSPLVSISGVVPTTPTANVLGAGISMTVTSAGNQAFVQEAARFTLAAGYTGAKTTLGLSAVNSAASTGTSWFVVQDVNIGVAGTANGTTSGWNVGGQGIAQGSSTGNVGGFWRAISNVNTPALNVGLVGAANAATTNIGIFAGLYGSAPAFGSTSAALIADNGTVAAPPLEIRDNALAVFRIPDGGGAQLVDQGTKPTCDATARGTFWYDAGAAGVADTVEVCRKDAANNYAWVSLY